MKIAIHTLGCKLNQYETKFLEETATKIGYKIVPFNDKADVYIINTCTVTAKSDLHARQFMRRVKKLNPNCKLVVTGCYAQRDPTSIKNIPEVDLVLGNLEKNKLFYYVAENFPTNDRVVVSKNIPKHVDTFYDIKSFSGYTRAFMKIQDGCDSSCSYCIVPKVRGPSRSLDPRIAMERVSNFLERGYKEIVLTGVHIGKYGLDLNPPTNLISLLQKLCSIESAFRIRISSLEPMEITDELLECFVKYSKICPHFHIPLQSGDDEILEKMSRPYNTLYYSKLVGKIKNILPDACIGADIITGFPGETGKHFSNTYNFISSIPLSYLHVFSFSPRPGTPASTMNMHVNRETTKFRTQKLRRLSQEKYFSFRNTLFNKPLKTLIFSNVSKVSSLQTGLSSNYIHVYVKGKKLDVNRIYDLKIKNVQYSITLAEPD